jgi:hypothetical protein
VQSVGSAFKGRMIQIEGYGVCCGCVVTLAWREGQKVDRADDTFLSVLPSRYFTKLIGETCQMIGKMIFILASGFHPLSSLSATQQKADEGALLRDKGSSGKSFRHKSGI